MLHHAVIKNEMSGKNFVEDILDMFDDKISAAWEP